MTRREIAALVVVAFLCVGAGLAHYLGAPSVPSFLLATLALAGLAWTVGMATEQVGARLGPAATGVLQSTLGNLPEFFVVVFALRAGNTVVAQTSIIGSIFANALLVLGLVILAGARRSPDGMMRFHRRLPNDTATLLLLSVFAIVLVGISVASNDKASHHVQGLSIVASICLLAGYAAWVVPYVRSGAKGEPHPHAPRVPTTVSVALLLAAGVGSAFVSDWFVSELSPSMDALHLSDAFAGIVVVAIAGNAVENVAGIMLAAKGQSDLAISVVKNSVSQIAVFLFPLLILVSLFFTTPLTFSLAPVYIGALTLTALAMWQITGDGEAAAFEGVSLIGLYVILATLTLYE